MPPSPHMASLYSKDALNPSVRAAERSPWVFFVTVSSSVDSHCVGVLRISYAAGLLSRERGLFAR